MLSAKRVTKSFGGVQALRGVDLEVRPGEVHALLGANGAGKSTLVSILVGAATPDSGELSLDGAEVAFSSVRDAVGHGVAVVAQELSLFPDLDVLSNLFSLREPRRVGLIQRGRMQALAAPVIDRVGFTASLDRPVGSLALGEQQLVEIAKALLAEPRFLLLDEPTSALQAAETRRLLSVVRGLRDSGVGVIYVSHFLEEVLSVSDVVTVIRDGATSLSRVPAGGVSVAGLATAMVGQTRAAVPATAQGQLNAEPASAAGDLVVTNAEITGQLARVSLRARPGEVLGVVGLEGSGTAGLFDALFGVRRLERGRVQLPTGASQPRSVERAVRSGVALVPADRKTTGAMLERTLWENASLVTVGPLRRYGRVLRLSRVRRGAADSLTNLQVRAAGLDVPLGQLSGGNQQKVVFAKWVATGAQLVLFDDPTRGVDIGAVAEMHGIIRRVAGEGRVVLLRSSHLPELLDLCDRVLVFHRGRITAELPAAGLSEHVLLEAINTGQPTATGTPPPTAPGPSSLFPLVQTGAPR